MAEKINGRDIAQAIKRGHERIAEQKQALDEKRRLERERLQQQREEQVDALVARLESGQILKLVEDTTAASQHYALVSALDASFSELTGGQGVTVQVLCDAVNRISGFRAELANGRQVRITWSADFTGETEGNSR